jgi:hypothetical protein
MKLQAYKEELLTFWFHPLTLVNVESMELLEKGDACINLQSYSNHLQCLEDLAKNNQD